MVVCSAVPGVMYVVRVNRRVNPTSSTKQRTRYMSSQTDECLHVLLLRKVDLGSKISKNMNSTPAFDSAVPSPAPCHTVAMFFLRRGSVPNVVVAWTASRKYAQWGASLSRQAGRASDEWHRRKNKVKSSKK